MALKPTKSANGQANLNKFSKIEISKFLNTFKISSFGKCLVTNIRYKIMSMIPKINCTEAKNTIYFFNQIAKKIIVMFTPEFKKFKKQLFLSLVWLSKLTKMDSKERLQPYLNQLLPQL